MGRGKRQAGGRTAQVHSDGGETSEKAYPVSHAEFIGRCDAVAKELRQALAVLGEPLGEDEERPEEVWGAFDERMRRADAAWRLWFDVDDQPDPETYPPYEHSGPYYDLYWALADVAERTFEWSKWNAFYREQSARAFLAAWAPVEARLIPAVARPGARSRPSAFATHSA